MTCGVPPQYNGTEVDYLANATYMYEDRMNYTCRVGYTGSGGFSICDKHGNWTELEPDCTGIIFLIISHTRRVEVEQIWHHLSQVNWSIVLHIIFSMLEIQCELPDYNSFSTVSEASLTPGSEVWYQCDIDYVRVAGDGRRICQDDGTWSGSAMECKCKLKSNTSINLNPKQNCLQMSEMYLGYYPVQFCVLISCFRNLAT